MCFSFDLSFYAHEETESAKTEPNMNKLIRVDWAGTQESSGKYDVTKAMTAVLEYEKSLSAHAPTINANYADIYLQPVSRQGKDETSKKAVNPAHFKLKSSEDSVMMLQFPAHSMEKGQCYHLRFRAASDLADYLTDDI
jgi:hypothetical protein